MADYAPPTGPPPPKVPEGWKAVWNDKYSEWFFVNIYTKKSQWDKPTEPVYPPGEAPPDGPPPSYAPSDSHAASAGDKKLSSNNPYASEGRASHDMSEDERLARRLQEEENARAGHGPNNRGQADDFYKQQDGLGAPSYGQPQGQYGQGSPYPPQQGPYGAPSPQPYTQQAEPYAQAKGKQKGGIFGKLLGKAGSSSRPPQQYGYPQQQPGYGAPMYGQPGYGQPGPGGYYGGPQQAMYGQPQRKHGLGAGGAAALGVGGGLLGGMLLGEGIEAAADAGDGGDYGGDGGDFGGDGGDFGGGDFGGGDF